MASNSQSPEQLSHQAASSEPGSTRPNPFDHADDLARKRRRTTASNSPTTSPRAANDEALREQGSMTSNASDPDKMAINEDMSDAPQTPENETSSGQGPVEPTSNSKVTLNLRKAAADEQNASSPPQSSLSEREAALTESTTEKDTPPSKDEPLAEDLLSDAPRSSSASVESITPPIEVVTESMVDDVPSAIVDDANQGSSPDVEEVVTNPMATFPFHDPEDDLSDTVQKLIQYLSSNGQVENSVLEQLRTWICQYLHFAERSGIDDALQLCHTHHTFWVNFSGVLLALISRRPQLHLIPEHQRAAKRLLSAFARLTAAFVTHDRVVLARCQPGSDTGEQSSLDLLSVGYLQHMHYLIAPDDAESWSDDLVMLDRRDSIITLLIRQLSGHGCSLEDVASLAERVLDFLPGNVKLVGCLAPICQVATDTLHQAWRTISFETDGVTEARQRLEKGHILWQKMTKALNDIIEKSIVSLSVDNASCQIQSLAGMIRLSLQGNHKLAVISVADHRLKYPNLPVAMTAEAVACEWRFDIFDKLIRSGQMQLRVMATTSLCNEFVQIWKRTTEGGDDSDASFMAHMGAYLLQSELGEYILSPNCHPEIIVEGANILGFLVVTKMYNSEHTDRLWHGLTSSQDPRVSNALARMLTSIINLFEYPLLLGICLKLKDLPVSSFSDPIKQVWDVMLRQMVVRSSQGQAQIGTEPYELCLRILQEASVYKPGTTITHPALLQAAMQKLKELLNHGPAADDRLKLYQACMDDIASRSPTTLGSLSFLVIAMRPRLNVDVDHLAESNDLGRLLVEEMEQAIQAGPLAQAADVFAGPYNTPRRDFIRSVLLVRPDVFDRDLGERLWDIIVGFKSSSVADRTAGWQIMIEILREERSGQHQSPYLKLAMAHYLPKLPPHCFCQGMHEFLRAWTLFLVNGLAEFAFDDEAEISASGAHQFWRIILEAEDDTLVNSAIRTLASEVYIESETIRSYPFRRARQVHLDLVKQCLDQLREAARKLKAFEEGTSSGDDDSMVVVLTERQVVEQARIFTRTLRLLSYFLEAHQSRPEFAAPDMRSFNSRAKHRVEGDPTELKYQSFDGSTQTGVLPLSIGKLNTAASLFASLKQETGFRNYRAFYRGKLFRPSEQDISKSLDDLRIHDGLILVRREEEEATTPSRAWPGSSSLQIEILAHFDELSDYLAMDEPLAKEIYDFMVKLPSTGHLYELLQSPTASHKDIFLPGQPYKSLYAVQSLLQHIRNMGQAATTDGYAETTEGILSEQYPLIAQKALDLLMDALLDDQVLAEASLQSSRTLTCALVNGLNHILQDINPDDLRDNSRLSETALPLRLVEISKEAVIGSSDAEASLSMYTFATIFRFGLCSTSFWANVPKQDMSQSISHSILIDPREWMRTGLSSILIDCGALESRGLDDAHGVAKDRVDGSMPLTTFFWSILHQLLPRTLEFPQTSQHFFKVFSSLLVVLYNAKPEAVPFDELAKTLSTLLLKQRTIESVRHPEVEDFTVSGLANLLQTCIQMDGSLATSPCLPRNLADDLLWTHLFPKTGISVQGEVPTVVLTTQTRSTLSDIVFRLVKDDSRRYRTILRSLDDLVPYFADDEEDPYIYELPLQMERMKAIRAPCGYVGLRNLSNTCYLNSLLTQLFMNLEFRQFFLLPKSPVRLGDQGLFMNTQKLFAHLQESYLRCVEPIELVSSIKTYDDSPIDIHSQMDVDEFYSLLFDRWEAELMLDSEKKRLRSFYGGQLVSQVKSKECEHISERLEPFSAIQCDIKGKRTLEESLQAYVDGEIMEGDNKYKCSTCDRHVDAVKRACLKDIPDNLIFHLKRFDFNLRTLQRSKINDYFAFPNRIDMHPYTIEHLSDSGTEAEPDIFELVGVLVHSGTAESGHYYSYIKEKDGGDQSASWIEFNDDNVTPWDPAFMEMSTFGGSEPRQSFDAASMSFDKAFSAYMLFYRRVRSASEENREPTSEPAAAGQRVADLDIKLKNHIRDENANVLRRHCLYDPSHTELAYNCFLVAKSLSGNSDTPEEAEQNDSPRGQLVGSHDLETRAMGMALSHLDQVVSRTKDIPHFAPFVASIENAIKSCEFCALAFFNYVDRFDVALRTMLQRSPEIIVRSTASRLLLVALQKISTELPNIYSGGDSVGDGAEDSDSSSSSQMSEVSDGRPSVVKRAALLLNRFWRYFFMHIRSWNEYFGTVLGFAKLGDLEVGYLLLHDFLLRALQIIGADERMDLPAVYQRMMTNIKRRANVRAPSYHMIIALTEHLLEHVEPLLGAATIVDKAQARSDTLRAPYPWTTDEIHMIHFPPERTAGSTFVHRLLAIDQEGKATDRIIARLITASSELDSRVSCSIRGGLQGQNSQQPLDPYLRAAGVFVETSASDRQVQMMIDHVTTQARHLQGSEGLVFLDFFRKAMALEDDEGRPRAVRRKAMIRTTQWAPLLLAYGHTQVRRKAIAILDKELFERTFDAVAEEHENENENDIESVESAALLIDIIKRLGISCLVYLRDTHVKRRAPLPQEVAETFQRVLSKCTPYYDFDSGSDDSYDAEFVEMQAEIMGPLQRLIVEEIDDNRSEDWNGSGASSDPGHEMTDMNIPNMNEMIDADI